MRKVLLALLLAVLPVVALAQTPTPTPTPTVTPTPTITPTPTVTPTPTPSTYAVPVIARPYTGNPVPWVLQGYAATGNGSTVDLKVSVPIATLYVTWETGTTSGAVQLESVEPGAAGFAGTWAPVGDPITFTGTAPKKDCVQIPLPVGTLRARVSTALNSGGHVTVKLYGLPN